MKQLLLTSHGIDSEAIRKMVIDCSGGSKDKKVCMIPTAAEGSKGNSRAAVNATRELQGLGFLQVDYIDVEYDDPLLIRQYDLIYIPGGNPFYLLFHLKKSGADVIIKEFAEEKLIVTSSAGTLVLGEDIELINYFDRKLNTIGLDDLKGLGLMDYTIYPHYRQHKEKDSDLDEKIIAFERRNSKTVTKLDDGHAIVMIGEKIEFI